MNFYPDPLPVPTRFATPHLLLEPLTTAHAAQDYDALLESKAQLRLWSGSSWPEDAFTLSDNRTDLAWHADEHVRRIAFTYTVLSTDRARCLGCVYIKPLATIASGPTLSTDSATRFWVTTPLLATGLDRRLLEALLSWYRSVWQFTRTAFTTRAVHAQQVALFDAAPLVRHGRAMLPDRGGTHLIYLPE